MENSTLPDNILDELLRNVETFGYDKGIEIFVKKFPNYLPQLIKTEYDQSVDSIFHCLGKNNNRCLILDNPLGNKIEILSHIFNEVYSIENNNKLTIFKNKRLDSKKITNVKIIKSDMEKLPFNENFFDLIVLGTTFSQFLDKFSKTNFSMQEMLRELKKILSIGGCLCLDIENKSGINFLTDKKIQKKNKKNMLDYKNYLQVFKNSGFKTKTYWVLPSWDKPYFSCNVEDSLATKWYLLNYRNFLKRSKISVKYKIFNQIIKLVNKKILEFFIKKFTPNFIFCCYKEKISDSIEDFITKETNHSNYIVNSRRIKTTFIQLDKNGIAKSIVHFYRYGKNFPQKIPMVNRIFPDIQNPIDRIWKEEWKAGTILNPLDTKQVINAIEWLFKFQEDSLQGIFTKNDISDELENTRKNLKKVNELNKEKYFEWLNEIEEFLEDHEIKKTAAHGDFWYTNMLYDFENGKIHIVDWEKYRPTYYSFYDLIIFIMRLMMMWSDDEVKSFELCIQSNSEFRKMLSPIKEVVNKNFNFDVDMNIMLRYIILRNISTKVNNRGKKFNTYIGMLRVLEKEEL